MLKISIKLLGITNQRVGYTAFWSLSDHMTSLQLLQIDNYMYMLYFQIEKDCKQNLLWWRKLHSLETK